VLFEFACLIITLVCINLYFRAELRYWTLKRDIARVLVEGRENIGNKEALQNSLVIPLHIWLMADKTFTKIQHVIYPPKQELPKKAKTNEV
jgi:hypothetical protein